MKLVVVWEHLWLVALNRQNAAQPDCLQLQIDAVVLDFGTCSATAMEILQSFTKTWKWVMFSCINAI